MVSKHCWILSLTIHGALILGAAVMAVEYDVLGDGEGSGFSCRLGDPAPRIDRIERPKDLFEARTPVAEGSDPVINEVYAYPGARWMEGEPWSDCCYCSCGGAATTIVAWPRDIVSYFDRKPSMATSRRGAPRLYAHSRHCAFRDTGLEADCNCGLIPPRY